jgi:hypothetical protein
MHMRESGRATSMGRSIEVTVTDTNVEIRAVTAPHISRLICPAASFEHVQFILRMRARTPKSYSPHLSPPPSLPRMHHRHHVRCQSPRSARKEVNPSNNAVLQTTNDQTMLCHAYANAQMECENMVKGTKAAAAIAKTAVEK